MSDVTVSATIIVTIQDSRFELSRDEAVQLRTLLDGALGTDKSNGNPPAWNPFIVPSRPDYPSYPSYPSYPGLYYGPVTCSNAQGTPANV